MNTEFSASFYTISFEEKNDPITSERFINMIAGNTVNATKVITDTLEYSLARGTCPFLIAKFT